MTLLAEAPIGRHFAQVHRDDDARTAAAYTFVESGLRRGHSVLVIGRSDRNEQLLERLSASQFHPRALCSSGQLALLDALEITESFTAGALPDWKQFRRAVGPMLSRIQPFGRGTRIYSEVAGLLWQDGNTDAAVRVEEHWNTLAESHQFSLYCCYTMDTHCEKSYAGPLEELGRTHEEILGAVDDERFGEALDRASRELFGIPLSQMAGVARQDGARRFPSGQRTMLWVRRNLPMSTSQLADKARQYFLEGR